MSAMVAGVASSLNPSTRATSVHTRRAPGRRTEKPPPRLTHQADTGADGARRGALAYGFRNLASQSGDCGRVT
jgi:hypothetical protein